MIFFSYHRQPRGTRATHATDPLEKHRRSPPTHLSTTHDEADQRGKRSADEKGSGKAESPFTREATHLLFLSATRTFPGRKGGAGRAPASTRAARAQGKSRWLKSQPRRDGDAQLHGAQHSQGRRGEGPPASPPASMPAPPFFPSLVEAGELACFPPPAGGAQAASASRAAAHPPLGAAGGGGAGAGRGEGRHAERDRESGVRCRRRRRSRTRHVMFGSRASIHEAAQRNRPEP